MKAITFEYKIPQYLLTGALVGKWPGVLFSPLAPTRLRQVPDPVLPGPQWVKVRPRISTICGSDMGIILCHESLTLQPFASYPFVIGHEVCGEITETGESVEGFKVGDRVTVVPMLSCRPRGIDPPCRMCAQGRFQLCENFTTGGLQAGTITGATAGCPGFMSEMGVAHVHQLVKVPEGVSDENATLSDPLSTCLHMVINTPLRGDETVLVFGCGAMGLCTVAALRALHPGLRILAAEIDPFHAEIASEMGVEEVIKPGGKNLYRRIAEITGAKFFTPLLAKPLLIGGVDVVFDSVGNTDTLETSLRVLANGGFYNLLGIGNPGRIDWTPVWFKELTIHGIYGFQMDEWQGERLHDFELAMRLFDEGRVDLSHLVTHRFTLDRWQEALEVAVNKGKHHAVKVAFVPRT
jgi:threonine dehydrogenase-like Zn-dependent dehydrogenase